MARVTTNNAFYSAIADAIRAKSGAEDTYAPAQMAAAIAAIPSGGGTPAPPRDINFYDFDGTRLYSYWLNELPLTALPAAPDHSTHEVPLTFQQWTHTLAEINACTDKLDVGATLIPTDGKTHLIINIAAEGRMTVPLYLSWVEGSGVTIDWGDGSAIEAITPGYGKAPTHTFAALGRYDIAISVAAGSTLHLASWILGSSSDNTLVYRNMLQAAYIGDRVPEVGSTAFMKCYSLASIVIPQGVTSIGSNAFTSCGALASVVIPQGVTSIGYSEFNYCYSLASIVIPQGVTSIGSYAFNYCYSLASIVIPQGVTSIGSYAFYCGYSLASIVIPQGVTSIGSNAFETCYGMAIYDFTACTAVPTLAATSAFNGISSDCIMRIPSALFATWSSSTNWSTYASKMVAV